MGILEKIFGRGANKQPSNQPRVNQQMVNNQQRVSGQVAQRVNARRPQPIEIKGIDIRRIVVDVETTGLNSDYDEILQLAICNGNGEPVWNQLYKPQHMSSWDEASDINGIFPRDVRSAPFIYQDGQAIQDVLNHSKEIVIYNAEFDAAFLEAAGFTIDERKIIDTMLEYAALCDELGHGGKWRKLEVAARNTGYSSFGAHDALEDVKATAHVQRWIETKRKAIEDVNPIRVDELPRRSVIPDLDYDAFEFVAYGFKCDEVRKVNKATGEVLESDKIFYADSDLILKLYDDIEELEEQINRRALGLRDDTLRAKYDIKATDTITDRTPTFKVMPLTASGKKPKFAMKASLCESVWDVRNTRMTDGVTAELFYLQNGELGKATLRYAVAGNEYSVQFKEENRKAVLSHIDYINIRSMDRTRLL